MHLRRTARNLVAGLFCWSLVFSELKRRMLRLLLSIAVLVTVVRGSAYAQVAEFALPRATPESQGIDSAAIRALVRTLDSQVTTMHSVMVIRHGHVVTEAWWHPE